MLQLVCAARHIELGPNLRVACRRLSRTFTDCSGTVRNVRSIREQMRLLGTETADDGVTLDLSHARIAVITLRNTRRRNAVTPRMMAELADCVEDLEQVCTAADKDVEEASWAGSCVVVQGEGDWFCAGMDLSVITHDNSELKQFGESMSLLMGNTLNRLKQLPLVSVAAVEGGAVGGGAETLTSCDHVVVAEDAKAQFVHAMMGLSPGWGGGTRLTNLVGRRHAMRLLCGAVPVTAVEMVECGLADAMAPAGEVLATVMACLEGSAESSSSASSAIAAYAREGVDTEVLRALKVAVSVADSQSPEVSALAEQVRFVQMWGAPANKRSIERVKAAAQRKREKREQNQRQRHASGH